jgi:predicted RNA binding protein YcfA (HicA-like mRNA interferase family)
MVSMSGTSYREIIRMLERDGWFLVAAVGSHRQFKHPEKPGKVTVPHPRRVLAPKTIKSILRQAGLL